LLVTGTNVSSGARILATFPIPVRSHWAVNSALIKELAYRGHEITVISPFPEESTTPNYKGIISDAKTLQKSFARAGKQWIKIVVIFNHL